MAARKFSHFGAFYSSSFNFFSFNLRSPLMVYSLSFSLLFFVGRLLGVRGAPLPRVILETA